MRFLRLIILGGLAFVMMAAGPQQGDLVELRSWLNGRSDAKFRSADKNKIFVLAKGTRGSIEEVKYFPSTKNYGVCVKAMNASNMDPSQKCVWIYYNPRSPNLNLYSVSKNPAEKQSKIIAWARDPKTVTARKIANDPRGADSAETTRDISGILEPVVHEGNASIVERPSVIPTGAADAPDAVEKEPVDNTVDSKSALESSLGSINQINHSQNSGRSALDPNASCPEGKCAPTLTSHSACTSQNNYLETDIDLYNKRDPFFSIVNFQPDNMIKASCIKRSLELFPDTKNFYQQCNARGKTSRIVRPCISENYTALITKSFNAVATCMAEGLAGTNDLEMKKKAAYSVFSLMTAESGLHVNAKSGTGAGGVSQLTGVAIRHVNLTLPQLSRRLASSSNPICSKNLTAAISSPLEPKDFCGRSALSDHNPLKNMIYGFAYQQAMREGMDNQFFNSNRYSAVLNTLPPADLDRLKRSMAMWAHNTGPAGTITPAEKLLTQMLRRKESLKNSRDVDQFLANLSTYMREYPSRENRRRSRRNETAKYYPNIVERVAKIESSEANSCIAQ